VHVQFTGSQDSVGSPAWRVNTTSSAEVVLQSGSSDPSIAGWGWADNGYGGMGPLMYFTEGAQTLRVQGREDGISIDQIVLSPVLYLNKSPGLPKNDTTILPPAPPLSQTAVKWAGVDAQNVTGNWRIVDDQTAAGHKRIEQPDAGVPKIVPASATPANYFDLIFTATAKTAYRLWMRGRAQNDSYSNDSVYVQFSGSVTDTGAPINRIGTTQATVVSIEECSGCGLAGWGWADNGYDSVGPLLYFTDGPQTLRIQGREDGISIDQVVLSPDTYLNTAPGAPKNDPTILPKTPNQ